MGYKNGLIFAAEAENGSLKWQYKFENYLINTVFPLDDQRVIFSNIDGKVGLLHASVPFND